MQVDFMDFIFLWAGWFCGGIEYCLVAVVNLSVQDGSRVADTCGWMKARLNERWFMMMNLPADCRFQNRQLWGRSEGGSTVLAMAPRHRVQQRSQTRRTPADEIGTKKIEQSGVSTVGRIGQIIFPAVAANLQPAENAWSPPPCGCGHEVFRRCAGCACAPWRN